ncbi:MAG: hypothetical protein EPN74_07900 [Rhodanobacter sp.]|nr:MAG: hypothetical protein EPN74_07900 [Rhodanobacter sp.]
MLRKFHPRGMALVAGLLSAMSASVAWAGPARTLYTPIVSYREWELELRGGSQDWAQRTNGEQAMVAAVGYGIAPRWFTEVAAEYSRAPGEAPRVEEFEWENIIQLTEHGRYWMDVGLFAEYAHNRLKHTNKIVMGPMLQKEVGRSQFNLNVLFGRRVDKRGIGEVPITTQMSYALQWRWHGSRPWLSPGLQGFGSLGSTGRLRSETFNLGPALFGESSLGGGRKWKYNAAVLAGLTRATPDLTVRFQLEYEFF